MSEYIEIEQIPPEVLAEISQMFRGINKNTKVIKVISPRPYKLVDPEGEEEVLPLMRLMTYWRYEVNYSQKHDTIIVRNPSRWGV